MNEFIKSKTVLRIIFIGLAVALWLQNFPSCTGSSDNSGTSRSSDDAADDDFTDDVGDDFADDAGDDTSDDTADDTADDSADDDDTGDDDTSESDCVVPYDDMEITEDTTICPSEEPYYLMDEGLTGIIRIISAGVTLVGDGVTIIGGGRDDAAAVNLDSAASNDITVRGFHIGNFFDGVRGFGEFQDIVFEDMVIEDVFDMPVTVSPPPGKSGTNERITIRNITARNSQGTGIACRECYDSTMSDNVSENEVEGIVTSDFILFGGSGNTIENNTVTTLNEAGCNAIWLVYSDDNIIQGNTLNLGYKDGSHIHASSNNTYRDNIVNSASSSQGLFNPADYEAVAELYARFGLPVPKPVDFAKASSVGNIIYDNEFHRGRLVDEGVDTVFCVDGVGNEYLDGATYSGPDAAGGTCP